MTFTITLSRKVNLGNYESAGVEVSFEYPDSADYSGALNISLDCLAEALKEIEKTQSGGPRR